MRRFVFCFAITLAASFVLLQSQGRLSIWTDPEIQGSGQFIGRGMIVMTSGRNAVVGYLHAVELEEERFIVLGSGASNAEQEHGSLILGWNRNDGPAIEITANGEIHINGPVFVNGQPLSLAPTAKGARHDWRTAGRSFRLAVEEDLGLDQDKPPDD